MFTQHPSAVSRRQRGLSRVDIAILITLLGAAAVVAVPRQMQLAGEVRRSEVEALARNAGSAMSLAHAQWNAAGQPSVVAGRRGAVAMVNGYPSLATAALLLDEPEMISFNYAAGTWQHRGARGSGPCRVRYVPPPDADSEPSILAEADGC